MSERCIFDGCVATWKHYHGGFPGGYDDPADPGGLPIYFTDPPPEGGAVRDYHGAPLKAKAAYARPVFGVVEPDAPGCMNGGGRRLALRPVSPVPASQGDKP